MDAARYLVMYDNKLWGYWNESLLRMSIFENKQQGCVPQGIYEMVEDSRGALEYKPISEEELEKR